MSSKKPARPNGYGGGSKSPYVRPSGYGPNSYGGGSSGPPPSNPVHGHDFTPLRGSSDGGSSGYSYGTGFSNQNFDDYYDGPGPKSFVSVSSNLDDGEPEGVLNINHGYGYGPSDDRPHRQSSASYGIRSSGHYESDDPLHPLRDYHSTNHDNEDMYARLRQEYETKGSSKSSPYFPNYGDYQESSPNSVLISKQYSDDNSGSPQRKKAYWSMSYVQDV